VITLTINWLIKPFTMAALAVLFFEYLLADLINPGDAQQYIAGLILLGAAPCTAMVFVWSQMTRGDPNYTLVQVSVNDLVMVVAFAPIVALLLGVTEIAVPGKPGAVGGALHRATADRRLVDAQAPDRPGRRGGRLGLHRAHQACFHARAAADRGAAVRLSGPVILAQPTLMR
jgi:hypothetical protein